MTATVFLWIMESWNSAAVINTQEETYEKEARIRFSFPSAGGHRAALGLHIQWFLLGRSGSCITGNVGMVQRGLSNSLFCFPWDITLYSRLFPRQEISSPSVRTVGKVYFGVSWWLPVDYSVCNSDFYVKKKGFGYGEKDNSF